MPWVIDYARRCFVLYVASLSDIDNPTKIALVPPANLLDGDFIFSNYYPGLVWSQDGSKLLLFADGLNLQYFHQEPILYYIDLTVSQPILTQWMPHLFSPDLSETIQLLDLSPDGQQILLDDWHNGQNVRILNLATGKLVDFSPGSTSPESNTNMNGDIHWLP